MELTLTHKATGPEHVGEGLKGRATPYVAEIVAAVERSDHYSADEKALARMALEWAQGRNQDLIAAAKAYMIIRDEVEYAEFYHQPVNPGLVQTLKDLEPYFQTTYKSGQK